MAGLASFLALVVAGVLVWQLHGSGEYVAPRPSPSAAPQADPGAASSALSAFVADVHARRTVPGRSAEAVVLRNAAAVRVTDFSARFVAQSGTVAADGSWSADVEYTWRFAGFDARSVTEEVLTRFAPASGHTLRIAGFGGEAGSDDDEKTPVWLSGAVEVRRTPGTLVLVRGDAKEAEQYAALARTAVTTVRRVLPWPKPHLVLEVAADEAGLEAALGATQGSYREVAAVTATVDGSGSPSAPVHVFVNPDTIGAPDSQGAQVVISHEATHQATNAATDTDLPIWLKEGFADYVALRDVDLPLRTTAGQILKDVRKNGPPSHLPGEADFDSQADTFGEEYEAAWLACRVLAEVGGEDGLVEVYDRVEAGAPLARALRSVTGLSVGEFTKAWQEHLSHWAA
ncbi:hypothetical protein AB3X52_07350 [Nocardioides sp. DS6]|uniref:Peptidase MA-like domain-containing protein n=1 Tax=Nocardioides eburneus TaxID=3231482 RepID=A0ABV3SYH4_9ACTN